MRILFLAPYPPFESPSQRYRFEQYFTLLKEENIRYDYRAFLGTRTWKLIFRQGKIFGKLAGVLKGFFKRWILLFGLKKYDFVFIHREAAPVGPPVFEWIIARVLRKKIIYDFDDAIWIPSASSSNKFSRYIKWFGKIKWICKWSYKITAGNPYLAAYAQRYNPNVVVIPTVVDTINTHNRLQNQQTERPVVGWTGTFTTLKYLDIVLPAVRHLQDKKDFSFLVIANKNPDLSFKNFQFVKWQKETEAEDLLRMHIGVMPLYDDEISKGKCGFKAIQYMSMGIPALVSPVGVNSEIVNDGINGFFCREEKEWEKRMEELLGDPGLRERMGIAARKKIEQHYSVKSSWPAFRALFE